MPSVVVGGLDLDGEVALPRPLARPASDGHLRLVPADPVGLRRRAVGDRDGEDADDLDGPAELDGEEARVVLGEREVALEEVPGVAGDVPVRLDHGVALGHGVGVDRPDARDERRERGDDDAV